MIGKDIPVVKLKKNRNDNKINILELVQVSKILNSKNEKFYVLGNVVKGNEFKIT